MISHREASRRRTICGHAICICFTIIILLLSSTSATWASRADGHAWFVQQLEYLNEARRAQMSQLAADLVERLADIEHFSERAYGDYVERSLEDYEQFLPPEGLLHLVDRHKQQLHETIRSRLVEDVQAWLRVSTVPWTLVDSDFDEKSGNITVSDGTRSVALHLRRRGDDWAITDVTGESGRLSDHYRELVADILDRDHSLAVLEARMTGREDIVIEDFSRSTPGHLPEGWGWRRKRDDRKEKLYRVRESAGKHYLAAQDTGASVILLKWSHWNPLQHPIMTWCWRADALPPGGDERFGHTNDSVAGIYVIYSQNWLGLPRQIKYVWSTTLPEGTVDRRDMIARPYFFVLESGEERKGQWVFEMTDITENYRRVFDSDPKDRTLGIGILTDANSTDSYAEAYYADIRVWSRQARDRGLITDYCSELREPTVGDGGPSRTTSAGEG